MISLKDLIDDKTPYSTTRWAFVVILRFAIIMIILAYVTFITFRILGIDTDGLVSGVSSMLGIVVGLATTAKALQGFETKRDHKQELELEKEQDDI